MHCGMCLLLGGRIMCTYFQVFIRTMVSVWGSYQCVHNFQVFIRDCTMVSVYPLLLFGGGITIDLDKGDFVMSLDDGWIRFIASSHQVLWIVYAYYKVHTNDLYCLKVICRGLTLI